MVFVRSFYRLKTCSLLFGSSFHHAKDHLHINYMTIELVFEHLKNQVTSILFYHYA